MDGVPADRGLDFSVRHAGGSFDEGEVGFLDEAGGELRGERAVGGVGFGDGEAPAGFLVEPVDDARALDTADHAQARAVEKQGVDQGAFSGPRPGVHNQAGRLVQHEEFRFFVQDLQRDVLGSGDCGFDCVGNRHPDFVAGAEDLRGPRRRAVHEHAPFADEDL